MHFYYAIINVTNYPVGGENKSDIQMYKKSW